MIAERDLSSGKSSGNPCLRVLLDTLEGVERSASLDTYLGVVLSALAAQFGERSASLWLREEQTAQLRLHLEYLDGSILGETETDHPGASTLPCGHLLHELTQAPEVYDAETSPQLADYRDFLRARGIRTILVVPIYQRDQVIGTFHIRSGRKRFFAPEERELAQALSLQAALALQLTRLAEQAREAAVAAECERAAQERAAALEQVNVKLQAEIAERRRVEKALRSSEEVIRQTLRILATEPPLDDFLGHVLTVVTEQLSGSASTLWFYEAADNEFRVHMSYGNGRVRMGQFTIDGKQGPTRLDGDRLDLKELRHTRRRVVVNNVAENPQLEPQRAWLLSLGVKAILRVPLLAGDNVIGMIAVHHRERSFWYDSETELAQALAGQASLAVQLTRLADQARRAAVVDERNRLAQEIHDTLAQGFTGILIQLEAAQDALEHSPEEASAHLRIAQELARESLTEARRSVHALRPLALETSELSQALARLVCRLGNGRGCRVAFGTSGTPRALRPEVADNLLRACQEALANALRHAEATEVRVDLTYDPEGLSLTIRDNGKGFDPVIVRARPSGMGLDGLSERARRIGGELRIESRLGAGTVVRLTVPWAGS